MSVKSAHNLDKLFYPKSVAFVGASPKRGKGWSSGNSYINAFLKQEFQGKIFPVHLKADHILGYKSYKSIRDIPEEVDLVIFTVPVAAALQVMEDCAVKGVKFVHLLTAGFSETGRPEHADLEKKLLEIADRGGVRILGPNCMGLYCPEGGVSWSDDFPNKPGPVGLFSQSGQLASFIVFEGAPQGLRFSKVASYGNAIDLKAHEFLNYLAQDEKTKYIGSYIEGLNDGRLFIEAARKITRLKPLVVWKGGLTDGGSRATRSHTSAIAGSPKIWQALCKQTGIISVDSMEELIFTLSALQRIELPKGNNVCIVGGAGGGSVTMTDAAEKEGLKVPHLTEKTISALEEFVPLEGSSSKNPLDLMEVVFMRDNFIKLITLLRNDPNIDAVIFSMPLRFFYREMGRRGLNMFLDLMIEANKLLQKPLLTILEREQDPILEGARQETEERFREAGIATFPTFQVAARVLVNLKKYRDFLSSEG
ncbi:MAG: CoA-binding protein [Deltaproteobacteria bacterium]|nr:CoA-binding protein [Deltaproteobacteria bacterium]MBW2052903.1 CoA-binding protein [Deltaproteobacteria bacterium]MBW2142545.1 CoA-binding protein [Deltaproteobacteria bacterium]